MSTLAVSLVTSHTGSEMMVTLTTDYSSINPFGIRVFTDRRWYDSTGAADIHTAQLKFDTAMGYACTDRPAGRPCTHIRRY